MSDQPEALRVATKLDEDFSLDHVTTTVPYAARLLREQHAEIEELREENEAFKCQEFWNRKMFDRMELEIASLNAILEKTK